MLVHAPRRAPPSLLSADAARRSLPLVDRDISLLMKLVPWYVRKEHTLPCVLSAAPLAWDERFLGLPTREKIDFLRKRCGRFVINPSLDDALPRGTEVRYTTYTAGRVLHCGEVLVGDQSYLLVAKGGGATGFIRDDLGRCVSRGFSYLNEAECRKLLTSPFACRGGIGLLSEEFARAEFRTSGMLRRHDVPAEAVVAIFSIENIPSAYGKSAPREYLHRIGVVHPNIAPVLLIRAVETNIRSSDLKNLLHLGYREEVSHLLQARPQLADLMYEPKVSGRTDPKVSGRIQCELPGQIGNAASWRAADLTLAGNLIDTELAPGTLQAMGRSEEALAHFWSARRELAITEMKNTLSRRRIGVVLGGAASIVHQK